MAETQLSGMRYFAIQSKMENALITAMEVTKANDKLFTADNSGFIYQWNLDEYALDMDEAEPPERQCRRPSKNSHDHQT